MITIFLLLASLFLAGAFLGWFLTSARRLKKGPSPETLYAWFSKMDEKERSLILYPLVKSVYHGRRTIHGCPERKGKTTNLLNNV